MRRSYTWISIVVGFAVVVGAASGRARDPCHAKCEAWLASCLPACADAPVVAQCRANCLFAYRQCVSDCDD